MSKNITYERIVIFIEVGMADTLSLALFHVDVVEANNRRRQVREYLMASFVLSCLSSCYR